MPARTRRRVETTPEKKAAHEPRKHTEHHRRRGEDGVSGSPREPHATMRVVDQSPASESADAIPTAELPEVFHLSLEPCIDEPTTYIPSLTPTYLSDTIVPFLAALDTIYQLTQEIQGIPPTPLKIRSLIRLSPVQVSLEGIPNTLRFLRELLSERWRPTAEQLGEGQAQEAKAAAEMETATAHAESPRADAALRQEQAGLLKLQNLQMMLQMAREYVQTVNPNLPKDSCDAFAYLLVPSFSTLFAIPVKLTEPPHAAHAETAPADQARQTAA